MQTSNARLLLASALLLVALSCVGAVVWWLTSGEPLSAQEQVADACANSEPVESVDFTINWYDPEGNLAARDIGHTTATGMYIQHYDPNAPNTGPRSNNSGRSDGLMSESIQIWGSDALTRAAPGESVSVSKYQRGYEGGQWTRWEARQDSSPGGAGSNNRFCSWDLDRFTTFVYNGTETLDGVSTKKFTGTIQYTLDRTDVWEFWVNGDGEVPLNKLTTNGYVLETISSGFNEPNVIAAPVQPTPTPDAPTR